MGTNYYMMTNDKDIAEVYFPGEYEIVDNPYLGYEIHIGKCSMGWNPLFEWHEHAYKSVSQMLRFLQFHILDIEIFDEYGEKYSIQKLKDELIDWGNHQPVRYMKYIPEGIFNEILGWREYLVESTKDDYDIVCPFDHIEYDKLDPHNEKRWRDPNREPMYFKDNDGYDFTKGRFS